MLPSKKNMSFSIALFSAHFWDSQTTTHLHLNCQATPKKFGGQETPRSQGDGNDSGFTTFHLYLDARTLKSGRASIPLKMMAKEEPSGKPFLGLGLFSGRTVSFGEGNRLPLRTVQWWRISMQLSVTSVFAGSLGYPGEGTLRRNALLQPSQLLATVQSWWIRISIINLRIFGS